MQLIDFFDAAAMREPNRIAFVQPDGATLTYAESAAAVQAIASALQGAGVPQGSRIAVYSPNDARAFLVMLAVLRVGGIWVPLNARNSVADNIAFLLSTEATVLFYHGQFEAEVAQLRAAAPALALCVCLDGPGRAGPALAAFQARAAGPVAALPEDRLRPCNILATGGTTGRSKGAVWTNLTWQTLVASFWTSTPAVRHPVHLCVAPMTHGAGVLALTLLTHAPTNILMTSADPAAILDAIERHRVTHLFLPPTVLYALLASPLLRQRDTSSLVVFLISAAPVSSDKLREAVAALGPVMHQSWGQAEAPFFLTFLTAEDHARAVADEAAGELLRSCGRPTMFSRVEIMSDDGKLLPPRELGEIVARSDLVMPGYYNDPVATAAVSQHGWHHTGDVGFKDEAGYVFIVDRKRDMIISGGFNVFSTEVEERVLAHPAVQDCAVIGVPDEKWGEAVKAVVELKPGAEATSDELIAHCRAALGGIKTPKSVEIWETLPRSPVGKVLKRAIRERFWTGRDRAV
ncbi:hypothetical protein VQ02_13790 [Methylobacterium variabile]|uniref:3-methylmercaptopropionyl-CoA ligase n=1 Tax=Methylobacterium variabile TaxID=298794 RepID=A0A0J6SV60_9HYPH|nr:AMP-binding protein [Methylobacterium variabile]KMO37228.1 hypothetical protein VQ02_13790 [Methylobacterium variabile]